jgi:hypothetical protein
MFLTVELCVLTEAESENCCNYYFDSEPLCLTVAEYTHSSLVPSNVSNGKTYS